MSCPVKQVLLEIWAKFFEKKNPQRNLCFSRVVGKKPAMLLKRTPPLPSRYRYFLQTPPSIKQICIVFCNQTIYCWLPPFDFIFKHRERCFISEGINSQILDPIWEKDSLPLEKILTCGTMNSS